MSKEEFKSAHWKRKVYIRGLSRLFDVTLWIVLSFAGADDFIRSDSCGQTAQHLL